MPRLEECTAAEVAQLLGLLSHPEGGFFRETYRSGTTAGASKGQTDEGGALMATDRAPPKRNVLTSIFYMLTKEAPLGFWHMNRSDIVHYFQGGAPLTYHLIHPDGSYERHVLGPNVAAGHTMQLIVPGGVWKATVLEGGEGKEDHWGLLGEAVAPGFDYRDMRFGDAAEMQKDFPALWPDKIEPYLKKK